MKRCITLLLAAALMLCLAACGEEKTPEETARQFLDALLADDAELQQAILDNVTVIGLGVPDPTEEELARREESSGRLDELTRDRFAGLAGPELLAENAEDGCLRRCQTQLAFRGCRAAVSQCVFEDKYSRMVFDAVVHCGNGAEERDLPLRGEIVFGEDGLVSSFLLYKDEDGFTGWLWQQETVVLNERLEEQSSQP